MGYDVKVHTGNVRGERGGALTVIGFDWEHQTMMGGAGIPAKNWGGPRYGISW